MAKAAVCSKAVVLLLSIHCELLHPLFVRVLCLVIVVFFFIIFIMSCDC